MERCITEGLIEAFIERLRAEERSAGTIEKYRRDVTEFAMWLGGRAVDREQTASWRESLLREGRRPGTVNGKLTALCAFFRFTGWEECRVHFLKLQRQLFREDGRELAREEYEKLIKTAQEQGKARLALLLETVCAAGIRVSELRYITVEAARAGRADVALKGKIRTILLPGKLCRRLLKYAKQQKTASGAIFRGKDGKALSRFQIWKLMKQIAKKAGVTAEKVFPHNLRHLFAVSFYQATHDVVKLADLLGHSSVNTTRIYLLTTGREHTKAIEQLGLLR